MHPQTCELHMFCVRMVDAGKNQSSVIQTPWTIVNPLCLLFIQELKLIKSGIALYSKYAENDNYVFNSLSPTITLKMTYKCLDIKA